MRIPMANYFSMGACAQVGYDFEGDRTDTKAYNEAIYAFKGAKHFLFGCCTSDDGVKTLNDLVDHI